MLQGTLQTPFGEFYHIGISSNNTGAFSIKSLQIQLSNFDNYRDIAYPTDKIGKNIIAYSFTKHMTMAININLHEKIYIKQCKNENIYKCMSHKYHEIFDKFNCSSKCIPFLLLSLFDHDDTIQMCSNDKEHYCMMSTNAFTAWNDLFASCEKQCKSRIKNIRYTTEESKHYSKHALHSLDMFVILDPIKTYHQEYYIYDTLGLIGSVGGLLGLFIGFSFYDTICYIFKIISSKYRIRSIDSN